MNHQRKTGKRENGNPSDGNIIKAKCAGGLKFRIGKPSSDEIETIWRSLCEFTGRVDLLNEPHEWFFKDIGNDDAIVIFKKEELVGVCGGPLDEHHYIPLFLYILPPHCAEIDPATLLESLVNIWRKELKATKIMVEYGAWLKTLGARYIDYDLSRFGFRSHYRIVMERELAPTEKEGLEDKFQKKFPLENINITSINEESIREIKTILLSRPEPGLEDVWDETFIDNNVKSVDNPDAIVRLGAFKGEKLIGFIFADKEGIIRYMAVSQEFSGKGIGRALLEKALSLLYSYGITKSTLWVTSANFPAQKIYKACNYKETERFKIWTWTEDKRR